MSSPICPIEEFVPVWATDITALLMWKTFLLDSSLQGVRWIKTLCGFTTKTKAAHRCGSVEWIPIMVKLGAAVWFLLAFNHKYYRYTVDTHFITCLYVSCSVRSRQESSTVSSMVRIASPRSFRNTWADVLIHWYYAQLWLFIAAILAFIYHTCTIVDIGCQEGDENSDR